MHNSTDWGLVAVAAMVLIGVLGFLAWLGVIIWHGQVYGARVHTARVAACAHLHDPAAQYACLRDQR